MTKKCLVCKKCIKRKISKDEEYFVCENCSSKHSAKDYKFKNKTLKDALLLVFPDKPNDD